MTEVDKIYNEDCLQLLSRIDDESVDIVVTSPPYNKNIYASSSGDTKSWSNLRGRQIAYDTYDDAMAPEDYERWQKKVISECLRILKPTGSMFYNHKDILVDGLIVSPKWVYDFPVHQQIVWNRGSSLANDPHYFQPITEYIYWIVKDPKQFYFDKSKSAFRQSVWNINFDINTDHPAPFPIKLAQNCIATTAPPIRNVLYTTHLWEVQARQSQPFVKNVTTSAVRFHQSIAKWQEKEYKSNNHN